MFIFERVDDGVQTRIGKGEENKQPIQNPVKVGLRNYTEMIDKESELIGCPANDESDHDYEQEFNDFLACFEE